MTEAYSDLPTIPVGQLGLIALPGCEELAQKIDYYLTTWRKEFKATHADEIHFNGYVKDSYLLDCTYPRFGTGEGKCMILESVRGYDIFIVCDMFNYGVTYTMYNQEVPMGPDEHYMNLIRTISAIAGKARRINVIMPMLYEGRQHRRSGRESLDCANALQELVRMGVDNIITFDAHDSRVQNAIPLSGFENVQTTYQMIKAMCRVTDDLHFDPEHLMIISPDEGGMSRCIYYATVLGVELGMFYKRRDYTRIVNGRNPIIAHEFLGDNVAGKDVIIVDDMISSGDSMLEVATKLRELKAKRIFVCSCFGLFSSGLEEFDKAYAEGLFDQVFTTNLIYRTDELLKREWFTEVDLSKYISYIMDNLNHDLSLSRLLNPADRIQNLLVEKGYKEA